jgi:cysteine desulfurase
VDLLYKLDLQGVCIAVGAACASASVLPSHVLLAMGLSEAAAKECVRISFGKENTEEEVLKAAKLFVQTVNSLKY